MHKFFLLCVCLLVAGLSAQTACAGDNKPAYSDISSDEHVVFFRTAAWLDEDSQEWQVPIHGWIYEPEDSATRMALFTSILDKKYDLAPDKNTEGNFSRRLNLVIADNERGKKIVVNIAGLTVTLAPSSTNGHYKSTLSIPLADAEPFISNGRMRFSAVTDEDEDRHFAGEVLIVTPTGASIISDIDDTVKISGVTDRRALLKNTFLLDFAAVPGMAELYRSWSNDDTSLHFVSSSPWQLYSPLVEFLDDARFPDAALSLKSVRFRDATLFDLFKKGTETKPQVIEEILTTYPGRRFILVGDSGEQDPEVYARIFRSHPQQIEKIYIRNVTGEVADNHRFTDVFKDIGPDCWQLFDHASELTR
jgi:phosphatidate phosphatase APP1